MMSQGAALQCLQISSTGNPTCVRCRVHEQPEIDSDPPVDPGDTEFFVGTGISSGFDDLDEAAFVEVGGAVRLDERNWLGLAASYEAPSADLFEADITQFDLFARHELTGDSDPDRFASSEDGSRRWFVRGGIGWAAISGRVGLEEPFGNTLSIGGSLDSLTVHAGAGVDWPSAKRFRVRTEATARYYEKPEEVELRVGVALAFR